jgi:site-specific recombinase XerD
MSEPALRVLDGERAPRGWEELWARDEWRQSELPHGDLASGLGGETILRFDGLAPPWLKEAARRWARARLVASTAPQSMRGYLSELRAFSRWLLEHAPESAAPTAITRELLTDYVLFVRTSRLAPATQQRRVGVLRACLAEQWDDGLAGLPRDAVIHAAEIPTVDYRLPRQLEQGIFDQFVDPANLARLSSEQHRTIVLVLATTGLRVSSVATLARDALEIGSDGHPYLRYRNHKLRREAMLPIGPTLVDQLARQQEHLTATYGPAGTEWLLPCPGAGGKPVSRRTIGVIVKSYVRKADIRGQDGQLASWVHPHLFRHHLATGLVNDGVALPVIQKLLDHASVEMTARYAHLLDDTVRTAITRWHERVNIRGERIALPTGGPLEDAAWMKDRIAHARQALPNGYCGLPLVQTCPHPNACLSCDNFLTDSSFRTVHAEQLQHTQTMLADARQRDAVRLIETLERDQQSLTRILDALDAQPEPALNLFARAAQADSRAP